MTTAKPLPSVNPSWTKPESRPIQSQRSTQSAILPSTTQRRRYARRRGMPEQLVDAITQWSELAAAAHEFSIEPPDAERCREALKVLVHICSERPRPYMVYLMENRSIAIDTRGHKPDGILLTLRPDGSAFCTGELGGKTWRKLYPDSAALPDQDLLDEIAKLD